MSFVNMKIVGAAGGDLTRSATGDSTTGDNYTNVNILNFGDLWISSLSGNVLASQTAASVSNTATIAWLKIKVDTGQIFGIPLARQ